jgi:hypothetical protein
LIFPCDGLDFFAEEIRLFVTSNTAGLDRCAYKQSNAILIILIERRCAMTKTKALTALATAVTLVIAATAPQSAQAGNYGGAVAAGVIGGLAAGAIIGSAAASGPYYGPGPVYYGGGCYWTRERFWDGWNWRVRRVQVCN